MRQCRFFYFICTRSGAFLYTYTKTAGYGSQSPLDRFIHSTYKSTPSSPYGFTSREKKPEKPRAFSAGELNSPPVVRSTAHVNPSLRIAFCLRREGSIHLSALQKRRAGGARRGGVKLPADGNRCHRLIDLNRCLRLWSHPIGGCIGGPARNLPQPVASCGCGAGSFVRTVSITATRLLSAQPS